MITCPICNKDFEMITNTHLLKKHNLSIEEFNEIYPDFNLCSDEFIKCQSDPQIFEKLRKTNLETYYNSPNKCINCSNIIPYDKKRNKFCCHKCANIYNKGHSELTISKIKNTIINRLEKDGKLKSQQTKNCVVCNKEIKGSNRKTCSDECLRKLRTQISKKAGSIGGRISASKRILRSKPEIKLYNKLNNIYKCDHNKPIFNGWDADIIIPQFKLAILWNGIWHYEKVKQSHKLNQVKNRDRLKLKNIKECDYNYIIVKDYKNSMTPEKAFIEMQKCITNKSFDLIID